MKTIGTKAALMKSLVAISTTREIRADEFTTEEYIASMRASGDNRNYNGLRCALYQLEKSGKIKSRKVVVNGKERNAYSCA